MKEQGRPIENPRAQRLLEVYKRNWGCDKEVAVAQIYHDADICASSFYRYVNGETALGGYAEARIAVACKISVEELRGIMFGKRPPSRREALRRAGRREPARRKSVCRRKQMISSRSGARTRSR